MVPLAYKVRRNSEINKRVLWMLAGLVMLGAVSVTGFQGGELTYGEGHYAKYYKQLFSTNNSEAKLSQDQLNPKEAPKPTEEIPAGPAEPATPAEASDRPTTPPAAADVPVTPSEVKQEALQPAAAAPTDAPAAEPAVPSSSNIPPKEPTKEPTKEPESPAATPSPTAVNPSEPPGP
jgi:hypothetical protein